MLAFYLSMLETDEQKSKFETIYTEYSGLMYHEAKGIAKNHHTAEDIVHDTCLHIIKRIDMLRTENSNELASLIVLITRQRAVDTIRKLGRSFTTDNDEIFEGSSSDSTEELVVSADAYARLYAAVESLNEIYRGPLKMKAMGYKSTEIAEMLSLSSETVRVRLFRGRQILQNKLEQETAQ